MLTVVAESAWTREQREGFGELSARVLGHLSADGDAPSDVPEELADLGIPRPAWFNQRSPTMSDVANVGLALRRST